jgi:uncharacterized LabA/DUF88 family protein
MSEKALLLIDGGYLDFLQRSFGSPRLDYGRMAQAISEHFECTLLRCVYFKVKLGRLAFRGLDEGTGKPVLEQKQVDVLLAIEMVYAAARRSVSTIILLSGDGDFLPAVELIKREGITFALAHGPRSGSQLTVQEALWEAADLRLTLDMTFLEPLLREV